MVRTWQDCYVCLCVCVCAHMHIHTHTVLSVYCTYTYSYIMNLLFIPLFIRIFIRFVLSEFFLSSLLCSFFLFRTFVMFTYTAVCPNLCSSSFSAGRSWDWTSATFPLVAGSSNSSFCWPEADFSRLVAGTSFVLCPARSQPHQDTYWMLLPCGHFTLSRLMFSLQVFFQFLSVRTCHFCALDNLIRITTLVLTISCDQRILP